MRGTLNEPNIDSLLLGKKNKGKKNSHALSRPMLTIGISMKYDFAYCSIMKSVNVCTQHPCMKATFAIS